MVDVFLLLGSSIGDRQAFLTQAIGYIEREIATIDKVSSVYETQSWGKTDEPDYLNQVVQLKTDLPAQELLKKVLQIEILLGRVREEKWVARTIDIDILFYNSTIINDPELQVPHPQLHNRRFTLEPLAEIAPYFTHPVFSKTILELKNELDDSLIVKRL